MFHAVASVVFIILFASWIRYESRRSADLRKNWPWIAAAAAVAIAASVIDAAIGGKVGNFMLHGIGGGVASACLFFYLLKTFDLRFNFRVEFVLLFAFVSMLGVMNELLEYALESAGVAIMSVDTHDTWRDFVANTLGAGLAWGLVHLQGLVLKAGKKQG